jgi:hypothetical protein
MRILVMVVVLGCGAPTPVRTPEQRTQDSAAAVDALRGTRFSDAERAAASALALDPHNSRAAAVRAIAAYQQAGSELVRELTAVLDEGDAIKALDHERGRAAWKAFLGKLDAIDRDLAVVAGDPQFSLELCLACWEYDWNRNGHIDERDRKLFEIEVDERGEELPEGDARRRPTFRFDVGDADWARAMIAFQRAFVELVLAYKWSELDSLFSRGPGRLTIHLADAGRVTRARELVLAGVGFADRARTEYLAETDDDREWVPNPHQKNHPVPLAVDDALYATWAGVTGDVRRLLTSEEGISMRELGGALDPELRRMLPDAYIDLGRMLREPTDIVLEKSDKDTPENYERVLRGLLGHGYATDMKPSPLVKRLEKMKRELEHGEDRLEKKLRYLLWLN